MAGEFTQFPIPYEQDESTTVDVVQDFNLLSVIIVGTGRRAITGANFRKDLIANRPAAAVNANHRVLVYDEVRDVTEKVPVADLGETNLGYSAATMQVTNDAGTNAQLVVVSGAVNGLMTSADKTKLDGIAAGANNYSHPDHTGEVTSTGDGAQVITPGAVTYAKIQQVTADRLLGRSDAAGNVEEIVVGDNLTLAAGRLDAAASTYVHPDHTGDATSIGDGATTVRAWRNQTLDDAFASVTDGKIPVFRNATGRWMLEDKPASGSTPALADLTDVVITGPVADNEMLTFDSASGNWINNTYIEAGVATSTVGLSQFPINSTTSLDLANIMLDETGSGALVFGTGPTLSSVNITSGTFTNATITLGANLDVGSSAIVSSGANDVTLAPAAGRAIQLDHSSWPLTAGGSGEFLTTDGAGQLSWSVPPGGGDVSGPPSSTANAIARFDGVSGKTLKNSGWTLSDASVFVAGGALQMQTQPIQGGDSTQAMTYSAAGLQFDLPTGDTYTFNINASLVLAMDSSAIVAALPVNCTTTSHLGLPVGTTAQRPGTPLDGDLRVNTTTNTTEIYRSAQWRDLEAAGTGTAADVLDCREFGLLGDGSDETVTLQAFFDELANNNYSKALLYGSYGVSAALNITGSPTTGTATQHIDWSYTKFTALGAIADFMLTIEDCDYLQNTGQLEMVGTGGSYATRTVNSGLKITDSARVLFEDLRFTAFRHYGLLVEDGAGGNSNFCHIRTVSAFRCGAGLATDGVTAVWGNPVPGGSPGSTSQTMTIDVTTPADDPETKLVLIEDTGDIHVVTANGGTTLTIHPWIDSAFTSGTIRYLTGGAVRVEGGDANLINFDQIDSSNCATGLSTDCNFGPYAKRLGPQACGAGLVMADRIGAGGDSINIQGLYSELNTYDIVKVSTTNLNSSITCPTAVNWSKVRAIAPRNADDSFNASWEKLFGVIITGPDGDVLAQSNDLRGGVSGSTELLNINPIQSSYRTLNRNSGTIELYKNDDYERLFGYQHISVLCMGSGTSREPTGTYTWTSGDGETVEGGASYAMTFDQPAWVTAFRRGTNWELYKHELGAPELPAIEGVDIASTGQAGGNLFLGENGDGTCSWKLPPGGGGGSPGGVVNSIQINDGAGGFTGNATFLYEDGGLRGSYGPGDIVTNFVAGDGAGASLTTGTHNTLVGVDCDVAAGNISSNVGHGFGVVFGAGVNFGVAMGRQAQCLSGNGPIAIGYNATASEGECSLGSPTTPFTTMYLGRGRASWSIVDSSLTITTTTHTDGIGQELVIRGGGTNAVDTAAGDTILAPGPSSGAGTPATVRIQGTLPGTTGTVPQTATDIVIFSQNQAEIKGVFHFGSPATNTVVGNVVNIDLSAEQHPYIDLDAATAAVTINIAIPTARQIGSILFKHDTPARAIAWNRSDAGTIKWFGAEPDWASDTGGRERAVPYRYEPATNVLYLNPTEQTST